MRIKMVHPDHATGTATECETTGGHGHSPEDGSLCPRLVRSVVKAGGSKADVGRTINAGTIGKYGEWFYISEVFKYSSSEIASGGATGWLFHIERFPNLMELHLDDFVMELASEKSFARPLDDACAELVPNGDAEDNDGDGFAFHPWYPTYPDWFQPLVLEETDAATGVVNRFYRNRNRANEYAAQRFYPNLDCLVRGFVYDVSIKLRIVSGSSMKYYLKFYGFKAMADGSPGGGHSSYLLYCPTQSVADGWVTCSGTFLVDAITESLVGETRFELVSQNEDSNNRAVIDLDDISIAFKSGVSI